LRGSRLLVLQLLPVLQVLPALSVSWALENGPLFVQPCQGFKGREALRTGCAGRVLLEGPLIFTARMPRKSFSYAGLPYIEKQHGCDVSGSANASEIHGHLAHLQNKDSHTLKWQITPLLLGAPELT
jgi:hypothetical protein